MGKREKRLILKKIKSALNWLAKTKREQERIIKRKPELKEYPDFWWMDRCRPITEKFLKRLYEYIQSYDPQGKVYSCKESYEICVNKFLSKLLDANKAGTDKYWIVAIDFVSDLSTHLALR